MTASHPSAFGPDLERILIVRLSSMGDVIHALPAAAMLRQALPNVSLGWLIEERWTELLCAPACPLSGPRSAERPLVDHIHPLNLKHWRSDLFATKTWERIAAGVSYLRAEHYQLALDLQGAARSAILARCSGAPSIYGAAQPRENVASMWYTTRVMARGTHVVERYCALAQSVTGRVVPIPPAQFPRDSRAEEAVQCRLRRLGAEEFVILSPGAGWGAKQWPAERYGEVASALAGDGLKPILNCGPDEEAVAGTAESASAGTAVAMSWSLSELVALTRRARLFIGGDTGPMHLAAALNIPVVALFGPTDPVRNGPFATRSIVLRNPASRTSLSHRHGPDPGLLAITTGEVIAAARRLLESASA
jgi:heptosyltransferase-1